MKKIFTALLAILLIFAVGCESAPPTEPAPDFEPAVTESDEPAYIEKTARNGAIIREFKVSKQPLTEIITAEDDYFAVNYNGSEPYFDSTGGYYYNSYSDRDWCRYLNYVNKNGKTQRTKLKNNDSFNICVVYNDAAYGVLHECVRTPPRLKPRKGEELGCGCGDELSNLYFIGKYQNGKLTKLSDALNDGYSWNKYYFAAAGIYYQIDKEIYLMDYDGNDSKLIMEIPYELYSDCPRSYFVVYRGSIWYVNKPVRDSYNSYLNDDIPLWSYDLDSEIFSKYSDGGLVAINNGHLYFIRYLTSTSILYRFNVETYCVERVSDLTRFRNFCFYENNILFPAIKEGYIDHLYDTELYKINSGGETKILDNERLGGNLMVGEVKTHGDKIFMTAFRWVEGSTLEPHVPATHGEIMEIDLDGNILGTLYKRTSLN